MSLDRLLKWHRFSVQTSINATKDSSGARNIQDGWTTVCENYFGHIQITPSSTSKGRDDRVYNFGRPEFETYYVIFHNYHTLDNYFGPEHRIITALDWRDKLDFTALTDATTKFYQVVSSRKEVIPRSNAKVFYQVYMKEIPRGKL